ncbi:YeiH family protein [Cohnella nanjingensis]|uniref:Putative sulfate exporter family transporter n=1 Tax=Cohnella nanjingensis TaxID=1387779 RepID=A0A7X0VE50_9BACL|nr:putative sulfate exporter family transporter [Cohnella nanjingensis]MBB6669908.1 putative sulfate exporter family transporter [Cohnella nanjingensis]
MNATVPFPSPAPSPKRFQGFRHWRLRSTGIAGGLILTLILMLAGWQLARVPGLSLFGPMACTLLIAATYRHLFGLPEALRPGIRFSTTTLLRTAIVLYGLKLPIDAVLQQGLPLLARAAATLAFSLAAGLLLGRLLKADRQLTLLLAVGTGICGAAAIAAVSPLLAAKEQRTAMGAGLIAAVGTIFAIAYMLLEPLLHLQGATYGLWSGLSLHEIAHVAMASAAGGPDAMASGMLAKLSRVFLLVPLCLALHFRQRQLAKRQAQAAAAGDAEADRARGVAAGAPAARAAASFPWFLLGFLAMSVFGTTHPDAWLPLPSGWMSGTSTLTAVLLTTAMAGMGLNVNLRELRTAVRPMIVLLIVSVLLSALTLVTLL